MQIKAIFILIVLAIMAHTCDVFDSRLKVLNQSNDTILTIVSQADTFFPAERYDSLIELLYAKCIPGEIYHFNYFGSTNAWPNFVKNGQENKMYVFFINQDTLKKHENFEYLFSNKLYSKKEYSVSQLEELGWIITYP